MSQTVRLRLSDEQFNLFKKIADSTESPVSTTIKDAALLWVAYTSQPLIRILNSGEYGELIQAAMKRIMSENNDVKPTE